MPEIKGLWQIDLARQLMCERKRKRFVTECKRDRPWVDTAMGEQKM